VVIQIQEWILQQWIPDNPIYSLFSGVKTQSPTDLFNPIFRPSFCDTFCYAIFDYMQRPRREGGLNRCVDYPVVPNISVNAFVESFPGSIKPVDFDDNREQIVEFYLRLEAALEEFSDLEQETLQLIEELRQSGADESTILRQVAQELFTAITLVATVYDGFDVVYYYGYGPVGTDSENTPTYWMIEDPQVTLQYRNGPLSRSYNSINTSGDQVMDGWTDPSRSNCVTSGLSTDRNLNRTVVVRESSPALRWWLLGGVLFVVIVLGGIAIAYYLKKKKIGKSV